MAAHFATTHWSLVFAAAGETPRAREALASLFRIYRFPLLGFVLKKGYAPADAEDLVQGFCLRLVEGQQFGVADRRRGRFRNWLLTALKNHLANEWDRRTAKKRGGGQVPLSLDGDGTEDSPGIEVVDPETPERAYERQWALALLSHVLGRLREECHRSRWGSLFESMKGLLVGAISEETYSRLAAEQGSTPGALKTKASRLRGRYRELLKLELARTVERPEEVQSELKYLLSVLA